MLANSPVVISALVESLRHDPFYLAITEGYGADEAQRSEALSRYFDYSISEGARVGRCVQSVDDAPAAAVWLLPLSPERAAAEKSAKAAFLKRALEPKGAENYHRIVEFMASRSRSRPGTSPSSASRRVRKVRGWAEGSSERRWRKPTRSVRQASSRHSLSATSLSTSAWVTQSSLRTKSRSPSRSIGSCSARLTLRWSARDDCKGRDRARGGPRGNWVVLHET
jgi:hypothetical protein